MTNENNDGAFQVARVAVPLRQGVIDTLRNVIALGHFKPGERLPERVLCEMTGVSRTLVREALRQLESEQIIEVLPYKGPIVARLSRQEAEGVYEVRQELEGLAAALFAVKASDADRESLRNAFEKVRQSQDQPDQLQRITAKNDFYAALIKGACNEALGSCLRLMNSRVVVLRARSLRAEGRINKSVEELQDLLEALDRRDAGRARQLAVLHVRNAAETALALLED